MLYISVRNLSSAKQHEEEVKRHLSGILLLIEKHLPAMVFPSQGSFKGITEDFEFHGGQVFPTACSTV